MAHVSGLTSATPDVVYSNCRSPDAVRLTRGCLAGPIEPQEADGNNRRLVIEKELAELNARPDVREDPSRVPALILLPISIRSVGPQTEMKRRVDIPVVQLDLLSNQKDKYPSYQAVVRRVGTNDQFKISGLRMENGPKGNFIRVRLPTDLLQDGFYQVVLSPDGDPSANEEYSFTVSE